MKARSDLNHLDNTAGIFYLFKYYQAKVQKKEATTFYHHLFYYESIC